MVFQNWNNGMLESWNDGFKETNIPTFHYSIIPYGSSRK
jgi:hypothetical protein